MIFLTRRATFSASHFYWNEAWSAEKNEQVFGRCANRNGHGHNYTLEVTVAGDPDPVTGFVVDLKWLKNVMERDVLAAYDHRHLNLEVPEFETAIPTTENIAIAAWRRLQPAIDGARGAKLSRIRVYETPEIFAEYRGPGGRVRDEQILRSMAEGESGGNQSRGSAANRNFVREEQTDDVEIQPRWEEFRRGGE